MTSTSHRRRFLMSLSVRLTLWYAVSSLLIVLATTSILYCVLVANLNRQDDQFLVDEVYILQNLLTERPDYADAIRQEVEWEAAARRYARVYERLLDADGHVIGETPSMDEHLTLSMFPESVSASLISGGHDTLARDGTPFRVISATLSQTSPGGVRTIQVAMNRDQHHALLRNYRLTLLLVTLAAFAASSLAAFTIARHGIKPIIEVTKTAKRVRSTTLNERIESGQFPSELTELVETFNEMLHRLQESFERLTRFSADIAHELGTPVNNMRGEAEVALSKSRSVEEYRESLASNLEETVRLSRIIDSLRLLARAESPASELECEHFDVPAELDRLRQFYEVLMKDAEIHIKVANDGGGILPDDLPYVFDRFYRVQKDRSS